MLTAAKALTALILLLHVYIVLLETVWFDARGRKVFGLSKEKAEIVRAAMSNQGCYNGFLVAALALGMFLSDAAVAQAFTLYGLGCIAVAGIWGAATVKTSILYIQTVPAVLALLLFYFAG